MSLNHHSAPLDLRGRFTFRTDQLGQALLSLRGHLQRAAPEAALLCTCNRTELYFATAGAAGDLVRPALDWLGAQGQVDAAPLQSHMQVEHDHAAARHVFRVAAGVDSMVLGEPQILGQLKTAAREAGSAGTLGCTLHQLFQRSFSVAKEVRTRTEVGSHSISMAAAAVQLAGELLGDIGALNVLFVGAGEMVELVATHFASRKPRSITLANCHAEKAQALAARLGARTLPLGELPSQLAAFDIVVSCTASSLPIIGLGAVERALKARRRRPMLLVRTQGGLRRVKHGRTAAGAVEGGAAGLHGRQWVGWAGGRHTRQGQPVAARQGAKRRADAIDAGCSTTRAMVRDMPVPG